MDSSESPVHGDQEGAAWNGHCQSKCRHPLFVFNQFGDLERFALRPGNVHSADGWEDVLKPVLARYSTEARPSIARPLKLFPSSASSIRHAAGERELYRHLRRRYLSTEGRQMESLG